MRHIYHESAFDTAVLVGSLWEETAGDPVECTDLAGEENVECEVAIIGAGVTGLSAAYHMARDSGVDVRVLEAGDVGWGGSGRNGGFVGRGGTKVDAEGLARRFGLAEARRFADWQKSTVELVAELLQSEGIDAEKTGRSEIGFAHRPNRAEGMRRYVEHSNRTFGTDYSYMDRDQCREHGLAGPQVHGGYVIPGCFGIHPMKYVRGLARAAQKHGVVIHEHAPVGDWRKDGGTHLLSTPKGVVRAKRVIIATNGYTAEDTHKGLAGRMLPGLSNILVTRPLSQEEIKAQGWSTTDLCFDSRKLLHYVRLLPDGRFMFGGRGGWDASERGKARMRVYMERTFKEMLPAWSDVEFTHFWNGFICLSYDLVAHISNPQGDDTVWSALAWQGSGVAAGTGAGKLVASLVKGEATAQAVIPLVMRSQPPKFPFPFLRTKYLRAAYALYRIKDEYL